MSLKQTLITIPDNSQLPKKLHAQADKWRDLNTRLEEAQDALSHAKGPGLKAAEDADKAALRAAIDKGEDLPAGDEHAKAAAANITTLQRQAGALAEATNAHGMQLAQAMRDHRDHIATATRKPLEAAVAEYEQAIEQARQSLKAAGATLTAATGTAVFLQLLDTQRNRIGLDTLPAPTPDLADARKTLTRAQQLLASVDQPLPPEQFQIQSTKTGKRFWYNAESAWRMIRDGRAELIGNTMEELAAGYERATGYAPVGL